MIGLLIKEVIWRKQCCDTSDDSAGRVRGLLPVNRDCAAQGGNIDALKQTMANGFRIACAQIKHKRGILLGSLPFDRDSGADDAIHSASLSRDSRSKTSDGVCLLPALIARLMAARRLNSAFDICSGRASASRTISRNSADMERPCRAARSRSLFFRESSRLRRKMSAMNWSPICVHQRYQIVREFARRRSACIALEPATQTRLSFRVGTCLRAAGVRFAWPSVFKAWRKVGPRFAFGMLANSYELATLVAGDALVYVRRHLFDPED